MSMIKPSLMLSLTFKVRTTSPGTIKRSSFDALDNALAKMDVTPFASMQKKIGWLRQIVGECLLWKAQKAAKLLPGPNFSQNTANRAVVVNQVADQAVALLKYYIFENQKANRLAHVPNAAGNRRPLQGGHLNEKRLFDSEKAHAGNNPVPVNFPGGSLVDANMQIPVGSFGVLPPPVAAILNGHVSFNNLTQAQFTTLAGFFGGANMSMQQPVHYARKGERVSEHMVVVFGGLIQKQPGQNYTTAFDMWAMDKYGNIALPFNSEGMYRGYARPGERKIMICREK